MLNIWKRTWKAKEPLANSRQDRLDGPGSSASTLDFTAADHPSGTTPAAPLSPKDSKLKRLGSDTDPLSEPPKKRLKLTAVDEVLLDGVGDRILTAAKEQNTIVILPPGQLPIPLLVSFLVFAIELESLRLDNPLVKRHRTALVVVNDTAHDSYEADVRALAPGIAIATYVVGSGAEADPWAKFLRQDVVVVTVASLLDSLIGGALAMTQIHALAFVDLQIEHGQMNPMVLQLMNEFYSVTDRLCRPRVFGFASCPEPGHNIEFSADGQIEAMDSNLLDIANELSTSRRSHEETILLYDRATEPTVPTLFKELQPFISSQPCFEQLLGHSKDILDDLGPCASDLFWRRALKKPNTLRTEHDPDGNVLTRVKNLVKNWTFAMPNLDPSSQGFNVSMKFMMLVKALEACEPHGDGFRGIVLVRKEVTALALADLLRKMDDQSGFLRPIALPANKSQNISQMLTARVYNLIVIQEEDVAGAAAAEVSIIIRFDALESLTTGRKFTYGHETRLIHMVERTRGSLQRKVISDEPQTTILQSPILPVDKDLAADADPAFIQDPTTGSHINIDNAVEAFERISSAKSVKALFHLEKRHDRSSPPFICTVVLPGILNIAGPARNSEDDAKRAACYRVCQKLASNGLLDCRFFPPPITIATNYIYPPNDEKSSGGQRSYTKTEPKFWTNTRGIPIRSLYPVVISTTHRDADMQPYAPIVILTRQPLPDLASFHVFFSGVPATICMKRGAPLRLTEAQVQDLYLYTVRTCRMVTNKPIGCSLANMVYFIAPLTTNWSPADDDAFNHPLGLPSIAEYIPWELVSLAANAYNVPLKKGSTMEEARRDFHDAVIQDRSVEFTKRYAAVRLRTDLSPLSRPADSPREALFHSILAYCQARRKGFEGLEDEKQPLIEVMSLPSVLNVLNPTSRPSPTAKLQAKYLIPELCSKCTIPASTMRTMRLLPSITRRIDDFLLVKELNARLFDHAISDKLLHTAISTPSCGIEFDYERLELLGDAFLKYLSSIYLYVSRPDRTEGELHSARLDLISNKSLFSRACRIELPSYIQSKLLSPRFWVPPNFTTAVEPTSYSRGTMSAKPMVNDDAPAAAGKAKESKAQQEPEDGEIVPSSRKPDVDDPEDGEIIPNSGKPNVDGKSHALAPTNKKRRGARRKGDPTKHWLGDKAVADVAEALMAAGYFTGGEDLGLKVAKAIGVPISDHIRCWADFGKQAIAIPPNPLRTLNHETLKAVEAIIGYKIAQPQLLAHALMHSSLPGIEAKTSQRLEFAGDAVLDFLVVRHLFNREKHLTPGGLTMLKGAMVSNSAFAAVCVTSGLYEHFQHKSSALTTSIREYVEKLTAQQTKEYEAARAEGRPPGQFWTDISAPKVLSDIVEAITGAVYVADNFSSVGVETVYEKLLKPFYDKHITLKTLSQHPTKLLFELFQRQGCRRFKTSTDRKEQAGNTRSIHTVHILVHGVVLASAEYPDANIAARRASFFALDALAGDSAFISRVCDCRSSTSGSSKGAQVDSDIEEGMMVE